MKLEKSVALASGFFFCSVMGFALLTGPEFIRLALFTTTGRLAGEMLTILYFGVVIFIIWRLTMKRHHGHLTGNDL